MYEVGNRSHVVVKETTNNRKTKGNEKTMDLDKAGFVVFNGRFTGIIFVLGERPLKT